MLRKKELESSRPIWLLWLGGALLAACTVRTQGVTSPPSNSDRLDAGGTGDGPRGSIDPGGTDDDAAPEDDAEIDAAPDKRPGGAVCSDAADCASSYCVDGRCCNSACTGICEACDQPAQPGICAPVLGSPRVGRGPCLGAETACAGTCDGSDGGKCRYPGGEKECAPAMCVDGTANPHSVCSGAGVCIAGASVTCAPFTCDGSICAGGCSAGQPCEVGNFCSGGRCFPQRVLGAACEASDQCVGGGSCVDGRCCGQPSCGVCAACTGAGGTCAAIVSAPDPDTCTGTRTCGPQGLCQKANGQACTGTGDCLSGFCVDGRCCNSTCGEACQSCALAGSLGTCQPIPLASDPSNCGTCGNACSKNHATPTCNAGACGGTCTKGWSDCNQNLGKDGCETHTAADPQNCGSCGVVCPGTTCVSSACEKIVFSWSASGPLAGKSCLAITESADPNSWADNFLCTQRDFGLRWSSAGPIAGLVCTQWLEPSDPNTWNDNFLCAPVDYGLRWSSAGPLPNLRCTSVNEPADPFTWVDNYICAPL